MFNNTIRLLSRCNTAGVLQGSVQPIATAIVDGPRDRKTMRQTSDEKGLLTIGHTETKENPGFETQRTVIRNERRFDVSESDKTVKGYVQLIISVPKEHVTAGQVQLLLEQMLNVVLYGENTTTTACVTLADFADNILTRLYAGEP